jgi:hypothetical protein
MNQRITKKKEDQEETRSWDKKVKGIQNPGTFTKG